MSQHHPNPNGLIEQAANTFMTFQVSVGTWRGTLLNRAAAKAAAQHANVEFTARDSGRLYVDILGPHHSQLKAVIAKFTAIRTYLYEVTQPMADGPGQKRGDLLVATVQVPQVLKNLHNLKAKAIEALDEFLVNYEQWAADAKLQLGDWVAGKHYPTPDEVRSKFYVDVRPPMPLQVADASRLNLPAKLADEIAQQSVNRVAKQLEGAKASAFEAAEQHFERMAKQLTHGQRLHGSLITAAKQHALFLKELGTALGDPRLNLIAAEVEDKVLNVRNTDAWKASPHHKDAAAKAATKVLKDIKSLSGEQKANESAKADFAPVTPANDGMMVDLW